MLGRRWVMNQYKRMEILFLPTERGMIKVHIYGYIRPRSLGHVFAEFNNVTVDAKGYNRNKTIIKTLTCLHNTLVNNKDS
jgi:hypothetical protein